MLQRRPRFFCPHAHEPDRAMAHSSFVFFFLFQMASTQKDRQVLFSCIRHFQGLGISAAHEFLHAVAFSRVALNTINDYYCMISCPVTIAGVRRFADVVSHLRESLSRGRGSDLPEESEPWTDNHYYDEGYNHWGFLPVHPWRKQWWTASCSSIFNFLIFSFF